MESAGGAESRVVQVGDLALRILVKGAGDPVLVLHHETANTDASPFYDALAEQFAVSVPDLPGYGQSERPAWARHPRDLAIVLLQMLDRLGLRDVTLVGLGFGGWIAAEMATMAQDRFRSLVLAAPFGIRPKQGEILDQMLVSHLDYVRACFHDEAVFERYFGIEVTPETALCWELEREMTARIAWKPYMFSHQLPHLLRGVSTRSLIVWGEQDRVIPVECGELYTATLPNSTLVTLPDTGHFIDMERPRELARLVQQHSRG